MKSVLCTQTRVSGFDVDREFTRQLKVTCGVEETEKGAQTISEVSVSQGLVSRKSKCMYLCTYRFPARHWGSGSPRLLNKAVHGSVVVFGTAGSHLQLVRGLALAPHALWQPGRADDPVSHV